MATVAGLALLCVIGWTPAVAQAAHAATAAATAPARDDGAARQALKNYQRLQHRDGTTLAALLALRDLSAHDSPVLVAALLDELEGDRLERFRAVRRLFEGFRDPETLDLIIAEGIGHASAQVRAQVILAMGNGRPDVVDWITPTEAALDDRYAEVRAAAVEALGLARAGNRLDRILELSVDSSVRVRARVPEALVRLAPQRALAPLRSMSSDESWRVRTSVVRALGSLHSRSAVEVLVDVLEQEHGRVREDALAELRRLARQDFGLHVDAWRRFLETAPPDFLDTTGTGGGMQGAAPGSVVYYGLSSLSKRFILVTDLSGSMSTYEGGTYRARVSGTRLDLTRQQMTGLIGKLDEDVAANLVTFSDQAHTWRRDLLRMNAKGKARALEEIETYRPDGGTNLFAALTTCFDMAQGSLDTPAREDSSPDTIFLLTDGEPSVGVIQDLNLILEYVAERNRDLQLRIHCIALNTQATSREFMSRLARVTTGEYVNPFD